MRFSFLKLSLFLTIAASGAAHAGLCSPGSFQSYAALGAAGCTVADLKLSNFQALTPTSNATQINLLGVSLAPTLVPGAVGFSFVSQASANAGQIVGLKFGFDVAGLQGKGVTSASASLTDALATGDGTVTLVEDLCLGSPFASCVNGSPVTNIALATDGFSQSDSKSFASALGLLGVISELIVDGGLAGSASATGGLLTFGTAAISAVPEPGSLVLLASALAGVVVVRRRRAAV